ncbi:hypothetical protein [Streptacidiphilus sp. EB129]|uniref:hypothetical protein n=1 Tax=Streptacidiphilus sp. EB129 TaxID=3156262 RepID=UPI003511575D
MSDDVEIPSELAAVYRAWWAAHAEVAAYDAAVTEERRQLFPDPGGRWDPEAALQRRQWEPEQQAELDRLRAVRDAAFEAMYAHPLAVQAREARTWKTVSAALQKQMLAEL